MGRVSSGRIEIEFETVGSGPPLLMIMGLGGQLTDWPAGFVERLAPHFQLILFDNRDAGLTTHLDGPIPSRRRIAMAAIRRDERSAPYTIADLTADTAGLIAALDIAPVHVLGMSMGGMIAQELAVGRPGLVRSLCSIMSHPGDRRSGRPSPGVLLRLLRRRTPDHAAAVDAVLDVFEMVGGSDWDRDAHRRRATRSVARAYDPGGVLRQSLAIAAARDRTARLASMRAPMLVLHGLEDHLVRPSGGIATARAVPGSRLLMFSRMGHDLPVTRHREIVDAIVANSRRASYPSPASPATSGASRPGRSRVGHVRVDDLDMDVGP